LGGRGRGASSITTGTENKDQALERRRALEVMREMGISV